MKSMTIALVAFAVIAGLSIGALATMFLLDAETWTIGPFEPGVGIRPSDIYLVGSTLNAVTWVGIHA